ncbi:Methyltransferase-like protein 16 [Ophiophagus hannah]|uniref:U6 small nuclear RNA (adenine-(43)-N(6))-methyltransferase n=1 Tax=Ophiophagus hannah TaxID=8665 RepID=V8P654_OPHHA|nr:Methyltransferase-like protein 16 [Ophiophagus hannah]
MALNKSMHERNRYKNKPPDFAFLASKYPEFKQHVQINLSGGVSVNFKDPQAVRALTCTGASCIYPLLGATLNGWYFIATEVDDVCFSYAKKNVEQNNLSDLIKVVKVPQKTLLLDALEEECEVIYDFCMCNPPFFANQLEAKGVNSRNPRRPPPSSVNTGGITEIMAEGGELEFVKRIIHDSLQLKKRLRWYSCMLGKKCSLAPLKEELKIHRPPPSKKRKLEKPRKPITFLVLASTAKELGMKASSVGISAVEELEVVAAWIRKLLTDLKVQHKTLPCGKDEISLFLTAVENSWIHLRRKKRDRVRQLRELPRASEDFLQSAEEKNQKTSCNISECEGNANESTEKSSEVLCLDVESPEGNGLNNIPAIQEENVQGSTEESSSAEEPSLISESKDISSNQNEGTTTFATEILALETGQNDYTSGEWFLFKCVLIVKKEGPDILIEMHWIAGQNRDLMNQLCTYLKNQMFRLITT